MTTMTHPSDAEVRPDVRTEAHAHRHRKARTKTAWPLFLLLTFAVCVGGLFTVAWVLGAAAHPAPVA
jgi:hypothetical protein